CSQYRYFDPAFHLFFYIGSNNSTSNKDTAPNGVASSPSCVTATSVCLAAGVNTRCSIVCLRLAKRIFSLFMTPPPKKTFMVFITWKKFVRLQHLISPVQCSI